MWRVFLVFLIPSIAWADDHIIAKWGCDIAYCDCLEQINQGMEKMQADTMNSIRNDSNSCQKSVIKCRQERFNHPQCTIDYGACMGDIQTKLDFVRNALLQMTIELGPESKASIAAHGGDPFKIKCFKIPNLPDPS